MENDTQQQKDKIFMVSGENFRKLHEEMCIL